MTIAVLIITIVALLFAIAAMVFFKLKAPTAGAIFGTLALFFALADVKAFQFRKMASSPMTMLPTTVTSAPVKEEDWPPVLSSVGSISAVQGAVVSTELGGTVSEIRFQNGGEAKKGDTLIRLDASSEEAQLHTAQADLELAGADLQRSRDLATRRVISKAEQDSAESKFNRLKFVVEQMSSMISKKEVHAPFDGQLGIRQVNVGQNINPGQQVVPLTALDPLYVDFALPQQELSKLSNGLEVRLHTDTMPGTDFTGKLTAINSMVDAVTRNVTVQATVQNPDHVLRPGMFGKVEVELPEKHKTLVVPGSAISYAPFGNSVFVIEKKKDEKTGKETETIRQQFVRVGEARGDLVAITDGLKPNELVVSTGVFKLRNGMPVVINNDLAPKPQVNPTPVDS